MTAASVGPALTSWPAAAAVVVGGEPHARHHASELLRDAGFGVWAAGASDESRARARLDPGALIVLLNRATGAATVRDVRTLVKANPQARILAIMPGDTSNAWLRRALIAGASGLVLVGDVERALVPTAHAVLAGQLAVPVALSRQIAPRPLSYREKQILGLVVLGFTNREIADKLYLAESTVKTHLSSAFTKLDARSRSEAVARILDPESGYGVGILAIADGATVAAPTA
jgi:DNA-binding NarL/FixJ family response regulator